MGHRRAKRQGDLMVVVGYVRVSTEEQSLGPEAQRAALGRWCTERGARLVVVHEDVGVSGGVELERRTGLLAAIDDLGRLGAGVLLVAKRDRLARDVMVAAMVERLAEREGARVLSAAGEGTDSDEPTAVLMRRMVDAFAEYERALIRARTRAALAVKKARGERTGSVPYGRRLAGDGRLLIADEGEAALLPLVRDYRSAGLSLREVGSCLAARGLRPRSGGAWHPQTVARILAASGERP